jgi:hypothetical protein
VPSRTKNGRRGSPTSLPSITPSHRGLGANGSQNGQVPFHNHESPLVMPAASVCRFMVRTLKRTCFKVRELRLLRHQHPILPEPVCPSVLPSLVNPALSNCNRGVSITSVRDVRCDIQKKIKRMSGVLASTLIGNIATTSVCHHGALERRL